MRAIPGEGLNIPIWILGSSLFGAQLAAMLGLPYAFASHFAPQMMMEAIALYRERFQPSDQLEKPYVMLGFNAFVADTDAEAQLLATSVSKRSWRCAPDSRANFRRPAAIMMRAAAAGPRNASSRSLSCSAIGSPATAARQLERIRRATERRRIDDHLANLRPSGAAAFVRVADGSGARTSTRTRE